MKTDIHPTYHPKATVACACGNTVKIGSTLEKIDVELCSNCHPFYTGKQKLIDTSRRVERFQERVSRKADKDEKVTGKKAKRVKRAKQKAEKKAKADKDEKKPARKSAAKKKATKSK